MFFVGHHEAGGTEAHEGGYELHTVVQEGIDGKEAFDWERGFFFYLIVVKKCF